MAMIEPSHDEHADGSWVAHAAGRAANFSARATARAWRGQLESMAEGVLSAPEVARIMDRMPAGPLPEELARSIIRNHVLERIAAELVDSGAFEQLVESALASPHTTRVAGDVFASELTQMALHRVAVSPELRDAVAQQTTGLAEDVVASVRASAIRLDDRVERAVRRPVRARPAVFAGIVTRAFALAVDAALTLVLFMSVVGMAALISSLVGGLRPEWLVGVLLASGWMLIAGCYFWIL